LNRRASPIKQNRLSEAAAAAAAAAAVPPAAAISVFLVFFFFLKHSPLKVTAHAWSTA